MFKLTSAGTLALNFLTPSTFLEARSEIKTGINFQLDWSLENLGATISGQKKLEHSYIDYKAMANIYGHDDLVSFNTQCGSQCMFKYWIAAAHVDTCVVEKLTLCG